MNLGSTPDQKGYWEIRPGLGGTPRAADVPLQPWATALYRLPRVAHRSAIRRSCAASRPAGRRSSTRRASRSWTSRSSSASSSSTSPARTRGASSTWTAAPHPTGDDLRPTYLGHSIGRWDGDTLVIDTVGFNEKQWLVGVYPTTERLHLTERISRPDVKTLTYEATIDDPGAYTAPWSLKWTISETSKSQWIPGGEIFEYICQGDN